MIEIITSLFAWLPLPLQILATLIVVLFFISIVLHLISWLWDLLPFV